MCGVSQGPIICPLLFLVYINDLPNCLDNSTPRMYADDTTISVSATNAYDLQNLINSELLKLHRWLIAT